MLPEANIAGKLKFSRNTADLSFSSKLRFSTESYAKLRPIRRLQPVD